MKTLSYKQSQELVKKFSLSGENTLFHKLCAAIAMKEYAVRMTYDGKRLSFEQTDECYVPSLEYVLETVEEGGEELPAVAGELSPHRGQIIALAAYVNFRFGARDFLSEVLAYKLNIRMVLRDGPDIGIVKYDNNVEIVVCEYMTVREMIMSINSADAEMVDEQELLKWREQFLELEEIQSMEWIKPKKETRVSYWDDRD
jgi:hypothetical protein